MDEEELDFADNHSVRACLQRLHILYNEITTGQYAMDSKTTLVRLALKERIAIEQDLRDRGEYSDFAPLALSAMQEALRTAINPRASGFQVEQAEIRLRFGELEPLELWQHFFEHYLGNVFEWNSNAANFPETQTTDIHAAADRKGRAFSRPSFPNQPVPDAPDSIGFAMALMDWAYKLQAVPRIGSKPYGKLSELLTAMASEGKPLLVQAKKELANAEKELKRIRELNWKNINVATESPKQADASS